MSHECHHGSCSTHKDHSHSSYGCGCGCSNCGCCEHKDCGSDCHHCKYSDELLALADEAWMELVKEKIKEEITKTSGDHINQIAALVSKTNHARWAAKMSEKKNEHTYEDELHTLLFCRK